ncbi:hypothetical protein L1049_012813 [Liquidambar formosana]|uniref:Uncharacterized protein n=1 Tax=Liquidambar formosana TaxID=63359 RepID=A0AAP0RN84_LIQFO
MSMRRLERTRSCASGDEDVDRRAETFIANFYQQLRLERQISLEIQYYRSEEFF